MVPATFSVLFSQCPGRWATDFFWLSIASYRQPPWASADITMVFTSSFWAPKVYCDRCLIFLFGSGDHRMIGSYCLLKIVSHFSSIFFKPRIPWLCVGEARGVSVTFTILISFEQMRSPVRWWSSPSSSSSSSSKVLGSEEKGMIGEYHMHNFLMKSSLQIGRMKRLVASLSIHSVQWHGDFSNSYRRHDFSWKYA